MNGMLTQELFDAFCNLEEAQEGVRDEKGRLIAPPQSCPTPVNAIEEVVR